MNFTLNLEEQEVTTVLKGLGKLPAEESFFLIVKIQESAKKQAEEMESAKLESENSQKEDTKGKNNKKN